MSTTDAINYLTDTLYDKLDNTKPVAAIFLDLRKAFDLIDHDILLYKMKKIGIRGLANQYFKKYFTNRRQIVKINNLFSKEEKMLCGVPQGSVLGPLFFLIYINEMLELFSDDIIAFADDTTVICNGDTWAEAENDANHKISVINNWLTMSKLILNTKKTEFITFSIYNNKQPDSFKIILNGTELNKVNVTKFLGIYIDSDLRWNNHIYKIVKKTYYVIYIIKKLINIFNFQQVLAAYYALIQSVISYGIIGWGSACETHRKVLVKCT